MSGLSPLVEQSYNSLTAQTMFRCNAGEAGTDVAQHSLESGRAGVHLLLTALPELEQPIVSVGTEVGEVSEEAVGKLLIPKHACPPGLGQHRVVGPVVTNALFAPKRPLAGRSGGVPAPALLPA